MTNEQITLCRNLTKILGYSTFNIVSNRNTGAWTGTTDYSLRFDKKQMLFISTGMNNLTEELQKHIQRFQIFEKYKKDMFQSICKQVEKDNLLAKQEGLLPIKCLSLDLYRERDDFFLWPYILMEIADVQIKFIETFLHYYMFNNELDKYIERVNKIHTYTAGGVKEPTFIFNNVRFSHLDNLYKIKTQRYLHDSSEG